MSLVKLNRDGPICHPRYINISKQCTWDYGICLSFLGRRTESLIPKHFQDILKFFPFNVHTVLQQKERVCGLIKTRPMCIKFNKLRFLKPVMKTHTYYVDQIILKLEELLLKHSLLTNRSLASYKQSHRQSPRSFCLFTVMNSKHLYIFLIEKCTPKISVQKKYMFDYLLSYLL